MRQAFHNLYIQTGGKGLVDSCCGMAGSFGYEKEHFDLSMKMAELALLPALRKVGAETLVVADGTSCRHQIQDGVGQNAVHVAQALIMALEMETDSKTSQ